MPRWPDREQAFLDELKHRLEATTQTSPTSLSKARLSYAFSCPDILGDRKLVRFLRGHEYNLEKLVPMIIRYLTWREHDGINEIRKHILQAPPSSSSNQTNTNNSNNPSNLPADHPRRFPKGELIISLIPQLVLAPDAMDEQDCPIVLEQYDFSVSKVLEQIGIEDYLLFVKYVLEYRSIILEQISEERERKFIEEAGGLETVEATNTPYGVITRLCVIRDLRGVGLEHLGSKGLELIKAVITLASENYPELMRKCYMINVPWVFNTAWYFVKGLLAARTLAKISVLGSSYMEDIEKEIPKANIPHLIGGPYIGYYEYQTFAFDQAYFNASQSDRNHSLPIIQEISATVSGRPVVKPLEAIHLPLPPSTTSSTSKIHTRQSSNSSSGPSQISQNSKESTATVISTAIYNSDVIYSHSYQIDLSTYSELSFINYKTASETEKKDKAMQRIGQIDLNHNVSHITISGSHHSTASSEGKAREGDDYFNNVIAWQTSGGI